LSQSPSYSQRPARATRTAQIGEPAHFRRKRGVGTCRNYTPAQPGA